MKTNLLYLVICICLFLNSGCQKSPECWGGDKDKGLIEEFYPLITVPDCIEAYVQENEHLIIRDSIDLLNILDSTCNKMYTEGIIDTIEYAEYQSEVYIFFNNINFDNHSILGFWTTGKCEVDFVREVLKDEENMKYIYSIKIKECGWCNSARIESNLVLIPKIEDNYIVDFKIEN
ncbi:MAG: hypothetical protein R6U95_07235 [Bacteroidales bacterium]